MGSTGKAYIVTGGSSGIGLAVAQALLARDAVVHIIDISTSTPKALIEAEQTGRAYIHRGVDVSSRAQMTQAFKAIFEHSPDVHGLVNSAGIAPDNLDGSGLPESDESFRRVLDVNLYGTWIAGTAYLNAVLDRNPELKGDVDGRPIKEGIASIVNLASESVIRTDPGMASYNTSKHAVVGLTRSWAKDFVRRGVRVNCVAPGMTDTPMIRNDSIPPEMVDEFINAVPLKRPARPEEVAELIVFLLGEGSSYMTGQMIPIEGGITI
ncbi:hypothetical protein HFD88_001665 [Aspergillus terreus]|nr:hypothetical protein HFD88_001665 [Aspergillus terreus]